MENIEHIVFSGGGVAGFIEYGIIKNLIQLKKINLDKIKSIHGTSVGSWLAVFLILKYDFETLDDFIVKRPWKKIFSITPEGMFNVIDEKGLFGVDEVIESFRPLFEVKNIPTDITLYEFYQLNNIELYFYSTNINTVKCEELSFTSTPDLKLFDAIHMSSAIPILFKPGIYKDQLYVDGGIFNNYPLDSCVNKIKDDKEDTEIYNNVLGIRFSYDVKEKINTEVNIQIDFINYLKYMFIGFLDHITNNDKNESKIKYEIHVPIDKGKLNQEKFNDIIESQDSKRELIEAGIGYSQLFLDYCENS